MLTPTYNYFCDHSFYIKIHFNIKSSILYYLNAVTIAFLSIILKPQILSFLNNFNA